MKLFLIMLSFFIINLNTADLSADLGPDVSLDSEGNPLKWEEGSRDYFVMFKSLLRNDNRTPCNGQDCGLGDDKIGNPQADACMDKETGSTFFLEKNHIPDDAHVERAFLVWTSAVDPHDFDKPTDNEVQLSFTGSDNNINHSETIAGPSHNLNEYNNFTYDGQIFDYVILNGFGNAYKKCAQDSECHQEFGETAECLPHEGGSYCGLRLGLYTYRVDVTDFIEKLHEKGRDEGIYLNGRHLLGGYNVSGMDCTNSMHYLNMSGMIGGWSLILIYTSEEISPKKIYMYDSLDMYQFQYADINVSGFTLPREAELKITLHTLEGDPGLVSPVKSDVPEALMVSGAQTQDWLMLTNACNPLETDAMGNQYTEIYNSISSIYGYNQTEPICIGQPGDKDSYEYSMDVDTFYMSAEDPIFEPHLIPEDDNIWLKVSSNQDGIVTNFMILSIDTKAPKFDIPHEREKFACSCAQESTPDFVCEESSFYYLIKIQNWGEVVSKDISLKDELPSNVKYVEGSTEIATEFDDKGNGTNWIAVEDYSEGDPFPFSRPRQVAGEMQKCSKDTGECEDTVLVRFLVEPLNIKKNSVVTNMAEITDDTNIKYKTNTSVPLRLQVSNNCPPVTECQSPDKEMCGGSGSVVPECENDEDCKSGQICDENNKCVQNTDSFSENASVTAGLGTNSPVSESPIIIPEPSSDIIGGQFYLLSDKSKNFVFTSLKAAFDFSSDIKISNIRIVRDKNGNGKHDEGETVIGSGSDISDKHSLIIINEDSRIFEGEKKHNFLILFDAESVSESSDRTSFGTIIESSEAFSVSDAGNLTIEIDRRDKIEFAEYIFEPEDGFIVTAGENSSPDTNDPAALNSGMVDIWQIKTKSLNGSDTLESMRVDVLDNAKDLSFGKKIKKIELYHDKNKDGKFNEGDELIGTADMTSSSCTFKNIGLPYEEGEVKHLGIRVDFNLDRGDAAQFRIPSNGANVSGESQGNTHGLPLLSKRFLYDCDPEIDENCGFKTDKDEDGCSITKISTKNSFDASWIIILSLVFAFLAFSRSIKLHL